MEVKSAAIHSILPYSPITTPVLTWGEAKFNCKNKIYLPVQFAVGSRSTSWAVLRHLVLLPISAEEEATTIQEAVHEPPVEHWEGSSGGDQEARRKFCTIKNSNHNAYK